MFILNHSSISRLKNRCLKNSGLNRRFLLFPFWFLLLSSLLGVSAPAFSNANSSIAKSFSAADADIVGEAFDLKTGQLLYREYYTLNDESLPLRVEYRLPNGEALATKTLQFTKRDNLQSLALPDVQHHNLLNGRLIEVKANNPEANQNRVTVRYRENLKDAIESASIPRQTQAVADAGFDEFVRLNWDRLAAGERLVMNFLMPSRLDFVSLQLRHREIPSGTTDTKAGQTLWIQATPANSLLRLFVDPIDLYYQRDSRRLIRYSGISNLMDPSGSSMTVDIHYQYRQ